MERRFEVRKRELLRQCRCEPGMVERLERSLDAFVEPYAMVFHRREQRQHARTYVTGLLSHVERKNVESLAYLHDQGRRNLQRFIGESRWDHAPLITVLRGQVAEDLGQSDGVLLLDMSGFPKKGEDSVGVARQWIGRLGKIDNGQVAVYLGYASRRGHALLDTRLFLPREWTADKARRRKCAVPPAISFHKRQELALELLDTHGPHLPHAWVAGDEELGRDSKFREQLRQRGKHYVLTVPANTTVRDLEADPPQATGRGSRKVPFQAVRDWARAQPRAAWQRCVLGPGAKRPQVVDVLVRRVVAHLKRRQVGPEEILLVLRARDETGRRLTSFHLCDAPPGTPPEELARVAKVEHRVEECFQRAKSETGLADYEVRQWHAWYHHQTLALIATWFLTREALRGEKNPGHHDRLAHPRRPGASPPSALRLRPPRLDRAPRAATGNPHRNGALLSPRTTEPPCTLAS